MRIPKHIAIIPDGNRRWAQAQGYRKQDGYRFGLDPGVECLRLAPCMRRTGTNFLRLYDGQLQKAAARGTGVSAGLRRCGRTHSG